MEMELIFPKKNTNDETKTRYKLSKNEMNDFETKLYLKSIGIDLENPVKQSSRYTYFEINGDQINRKRK